MRVFVPPCVDSNMQLHVQDSDVLVSCRLNFGTTIPLFEYAHYEKYVHYEQLFPYTALTVCYNQDTACSVCRMN
jgi:hypothetical protein